MAVASQAWTDPSQGVHHNSHFTLQKYLLLQEQHESLHQQLDQLRPPPPTSASARTSPLGSPTHHSYGTAFDASPYSSRASSTSSRHRSRSRRGSTPGSAAACMGGLETVPDESTLAAVAAEEAKLFDVNEGIKRALTELLNCEAVRADAAMRSWVQRRLMDAERELRVGRRRRSGAGQEYGY